MTATCPPINPFSTTFIRPGAIPFLFPNDQTIQDVVRQLAATDWWGQIIGPHGTGKSTLTAALVPALVAAGRQPLWYVFRDSLTWWPGFTSDELKLTSQTVLIIDGYEKFSRWRRFRLRQACRRAGCGLLVTAHDPIGLPTLYKTLVDEQLAQRVLAHLDRDGLARVNEQDLWKCLTERRGNLREALFDLYDVQERRTRTGRNAHPTELKTGPIQRAGV